MIILRRTIVTLTEIGEFHLASEVFSYLARLVLEEESKPHVSTTEPKRRILTRESSQSGDVVSSILFAEDPKDIVTKMAPRRQTANGHVGGLLEVTAGNNNDTLENFALNGQSSTTTRCCTPTGECLRGDMPIRLNALQDAVKVICNNDSCPVGQFMHRECFDAWEQTVLTYLKNCGRARSWSERQRHQNLWTKKGYDLAFKACGCRCGRGHLKKDLDWMPPGLANASGSRGADETESKKKKRRNRQNTRPSLAVSAGPPTHTGNYAVGCNGSINGNGVGARGGSDVQIIDSGRGRAGSLSSGTGSCSPPATSEPSVSPLHQPQAIVKKKSKVEFFGDHRARWVFI